MKNIIVFAMLLMVPVVSFSQQTAPSAVLNKQEYLKKSKKQSTIALATGIPGVALLTIGGIMSMSEFDNGLLPGQTEESKCNSKTGEVLLIAGGALCITAIPFQIASAKNKLKALSLSFRNEKAVLVQKNGFSNRSIPSLTLKIKL